MTQSVMPCDGENGGDVLREGRTRQPKHACRRELSMHQLKNTSARHIGCTTDYHPPGARPRRLKSAVCGGTNHTAHECTTSMACGRTNQPTGTQAHGFTNQPAHIIKTPPVQDRARIVMHTQCTHGLLHACIPPQVVKWRRVRPAWCGQPASLMHFSSCPAGSC